MDSLVDMMIANEIDDYGRPLLADSYDAVFGLQVVCGHKALIDKQGKSGPRQSQTMTRGTNSGGEIVDSVMRLESIDGLCPLGWRLAPDHFAPTFTVTKHHDRIAVHGEND